MGIIILIIAAVIEIVFGAYCIVTQSNQKRIRSWVRIGAFAGFVLFTLVAVITWSFRWELFAALLLVWAIIGGVTDTQKGG